MPFIYRIRNTINNKTYIGMTTKSSFSRRGGEHVSRLRNNKHNNSYLQRSWNKYGKGAFDFEVIEEFVFPKTSGGFLRKTLDGYHKSAYGYTLKYKEVPIG